MLKLINWSPNNEGCTHQQREVEEAMQKGEKRQQRMAA